MSTSTFNMMFVHGATKGCPKSKKTFCPKRLRKQLNNDTFKQFYFELVPSSDKPEIPLKKEPDTTSDSDKYMLMSFQYEASEQEKMRKAIHQCSSHFYVSSYMHHSKKKKMKKVANRNESVTTTTACESPIISSTSSDISNIFSNSHSSNSTNSEMQNKPASSSFNFESFLSFQQPQANNLLPNTIYLSPSQKNTCQSSGLMLSLDHESIANLLLDESSPFCNLLKAPILERNNNNFLHQ